MVTFDGADGRLFQQHGKDPNFPPRVLDAANRFKYDETLKNDPVEYQGVYEELKVEAALVVVVSISCWTFAGDFLTLWSRTRPMPKCALSLTTTTIPPFLRALSALGSSASSSLLLEVSSTSFSVFDTPALASVPTSPSYCKSNSAFPGFTRLTGLISELSPLANCSRLSSPKRSSPLLAMRGISTLASST